MKRYCSLVPSFLAQDCPILYEVPGYVTITGKEPGNEAYCSLGCCIYLLAFLNTYIPLLTLSLLSSHPPQCQYELLPPSLARFSPTDPDIILYTGYGLERCVQFYNLSQKTVVRTSALTHWARSMDVSPQGHLLAFGCQGE